MKDLLMSQTTKENRKLNSCGDILIDLLHNDKLNKEMMYWLNVQFDNLQEIVSTLDAIILSSNGNKEMLTDLIPYINDASFMIASFTGKVMELKERV